MSLQYVVHVLYFLPWLIHLLIRFYVAFNPVGVLNKMNANKWPNNILLQSGRLYRYDFYRGLEHEMKDDIQRMNCSVIVGINNLYSCVSSCFELTIKWLLIWMYFSFKQAFWGWTQSMEKKNIQQQNGSGIWWKFNNLLCWSVVDTQIFQKNRSSGILDVNIRKINI